MSEVHTKFCSAHTGCQHRHETKASFSGLLSLPWLWYWREVDPVNGVHQVDGCTCTRCSLSTAIIISPNRNAFKRSLLRTSFRSCYWERNPKERKVRLHTQQSSRIAANFVSTSISLPYPKKVQGEHTLALFQTFPQACPISQVLRTAVRLRVASLAS